MNTYETIHEKITVNATFNEELQLDVNGFRWKDKIYKVDRVHMINRLNKGDKLVYFVSTSDEQGAYKLRFDTDSLQWWMEEVYWK